MKTPNPSGAGEQGTIIYVTLIITAVIGVSLASFLKVVGNQHRSIVRSQVWNKAIPIAEAGIEDAMGQINKSFTATSFTLNRWNYDGSHFWRRRDMGNDYYVVKFTPSQPPIIVSEGFARLPGSGNSHLSRKVQIQTKGTSLFMKAMVAKGEIDLQGNNVATDSFDSQDPNHSDNGLYPYSDPSKIKDNGDVATNSELVNSLNIGNANIRGRVATGPGGSVSVGSNGTVGNNAWHDGGNTGIQPGYSTDDMNIDIPVIEAPFTIGLPPTPVLGVDGITYITLSSGDYSMSGINIDGSKTKILVTGDARLYVSGDISISGNAGIIVDTNASLKLYAAGATTLMGGNGVVNKTSTAENFQYYGLPSNTSVEYSGNADFQGTIYAPDADLLLGGGGKTEWDFIGASVSNTVTMKGHFNFHYDEALANMTDHGLFKIVSWEEL